MVFNLRLHFSITMTELKILKNKNAMFSKIRSLIFIEYIHIYRFHKQNESY